MRLSEILRHQATLYDHIITDQRYYPDYYQVTFYGDFPTAIRDKRFIVSSPFPFYGPSDSAYSIVGSSGRSSEHFASGCSTSILVLNCSRHRGIHQLISDLAVTSISNACRLFLSQIGLYLSSRILTSPSLSVPIMSTGSFNI